MDKRFVKEKLEKYFDNEDAIALAWNCFVKKNIHLLGKDYQFLIHSNTIDVVKKIKLQTELITAIFNGSYDVNDRYFITFKDKIQSINSVFGVINAEKLYEYVMGSAKRAAWESASKTAVTLWNTPHEEVKVEITKQYLKFYRRDDILSCYTYPPIHELKKDDKFKQDMKFILEEGGDWDETMFNNWVMGDCDLPPFPISYIFASDYNKYKFYEFE